MILHFSFSDGPNGAGLAAYQIFTGLRSRGYKGKLLVLSKSTDDEDVLKIGLGKLPKIGIALIRRFEKLIQFTYRAKRKDSFHSGLFGTNYISLKKMIKSADLIILYWVTGGLLSDKFIGKLLKLDKKIIWRFSDMAPLTGGCHYSYGCEGFVESCEKCPELKDTGSKRLPEKVLFRKKKLWIDKENLTIVATNKWMKCNVSKSLVFKNTDCKVIHTGTDLDVFKPIEKSKPEKKIVLIGAQNPKIRSKGFIQLIEMLKKYIERFDESDFELHVFGTPIDLNLYNIDISFKNWGKITDKNKLAKIYSQANIFLIPSIADNLPNTALEALACGTPVLGFSIGGLLDVVEHGNNGFLARENDVDEMANYLHELLFNIDLDKMSYEARKLVEHKFNRIQQIDSFVSLIEN